MRSTASSVEVGLAVEALVGALRVVDDVEREVPVVPGAAVLAADLLACGVGIGPRAPADRLVVGEQRREPGQRAEPVDRDRIAQVPVADVELVEQLVELADEVGGAVRSRDRRLPLAQEPAADACALGRVELEDALVLVEQVASR